MLGRRHFPLLASLLVQPLSLTPPSLAFYSPPPVLIYLNCSALPMSKPGIAAGPHSYETFISYDLLIKKRRFKFSRRISVPSTTTLASLHLAIMALVSFEDEHLYEFSPHYADKMSINKLLRNVGDTLEYEYDLSSPHEFVIELERKQRHNEPVTKMHLGPCRGKNPIEEDCFQETPFDAEAVADVIEELDPFVRETWQTEAKRD